MSDHGDDLFAPSVIADPYTYFGQLRETDPIHWNARSELWIITRYDDLVWLVRHHELFSSAVIRSDQRPPYPPIDPEDRGLFEEVRHFRSDQLVEKDRPDHTRMREAVHEYFTPTAMEAWRPFVRTAVAELLDEVAPKGRMDVLQVLAAPLPVRIITHMMGVPNEDREYLRELAGKLLYINRGEPYRMKPLMEGIRAMMAYVEPKVGTRAEHPENDFISVLATAEQAGVFTRHQVLVNTALLLFAGHETTMNLICNGTLALLRHPEQWAKLCADPAGLTRLATEECLRYDPPVKSTQRIAAADVERHGKQIKKGDRIRWIMAAANRDPRAFTDPDRFDLSRSPNPHVSFGSGIHYCLGATLARVEGQEVFRALAERFPNLRLDTDQLEYQPSVQFRSLKSLPVAWS
ncbi:MAG: cytochrome P450 [Gemmatimonadetes bacterium]|nr:cytochrome P450 [Gemmatimonadota bacterium]